MSESEIDIDKLHEEIGAEIAERGIGPVINNFYMLFPVFGFPVERLETLTEEQLEMFGLSCFRTQSILQGRLDTVHNQIPGEVKVGSFTGLEVPESYMPSEKYLGQTDREFYATYR